MSNWWSCPRCGRRLAWLPDRIVCPGKRCKYTTKVPSPIRTER